MCVDQIYLAIYIYTLLEREERSIYAMSRNPRVCPAQNNVWCCAVERSVTLHGSQDRTHHNVEMLVARR